MNFFRVKKNVKITFSQWGYRPMPHILGTQFRRVGGLCDYKAMRSFGHCALVRVRGGLPHSAEHDLVGGPKK